MSADHFTLKIQIAAVAHEMCMMMPKLACGNKTTGFGREPLCTGVHADVVEI